MRVMMGKKDIKKIYKINWCEFIRKEKLLDYDKLEF